ncbi:hypothetical protein BO71DRAFT_74215 [Aspergillus ellipticus CBS 707.79]|uniref:Uncharacterized protein n=1 Tax=Aspergillus ellipticus CBS 707.79 TaxID=1448320 RepID=A0A319DH99_9EURO|nr:hypothetical protein BO71DRAFT_74215 [Aspergillus ellipticus CBS 707.79]
MVGRRCSPSVHAAAAATAAAARRSGQIRHRRSTEHYSVGGTHDIIIHAMPMPMPMSRSPDAIAIRSSPQLISAKRLNLPILNS